MTYISYNKRDEDMRHITALSRNSLEMAKNYQKMFMEKKDADCARKAGNYLDRASVIERPVGNYRASIYFALEAKDLFARAYATGKNTADKANIKRVSRNISQLKGRMKAK